MDLILAEASAERLFPGEGGVDLLGLLRAVPRDIPLSVEVTEAEPQEAAELVSARTGVSGSTE